MPMPRSPSSTFIAASSIFLVGRGCRGDGAALPTLTVTVSVLCRGWRGRGPGHLSISARCRIEVSGAAGMPVGKWYFEGAGCALL